MDSFIMRCIRNTLALNFSMILGPRLSNKSAPKVLQSSADFALEKPKMCVPFVRYILGLALLWLVWPLASGALDDSRLDVVDIQPCFVSKNVVSRSESITYSLKANFSLCENFSNSSYVSVGQLDMTIRIVITVVSPSWPCDLVSWLGLDESNSRVAARQWLLAI